MSTVETSPDVARGGSGRGTDHWPPEVELILSALEAAAHGLDDRRQLPRQPLRQKACLRLYIDADGTPPWRIYTRDINHRGMGFVTPHRLPLGYGGTVELRLPDGQKREVSCTLLRCREVTSGWFEGSLYFNREQMEFLVEAADGDGDDDAEHD